jgi:hypothetical protein
MHVWLFVCAVRACKCVCGYAYMHPSRSVDVPLSCTRDVTVCLLAHQSYSRNVPQLKSVRVHGRGTLIFWRPGRISSSPPNAYRFFKAMDLLVSRPPGSARGYQQRPLASCQWRSQNRDPGLAKAMALSSRSVHESCHSPELERMRLNSVCACELAGGVGVSSISPKTRGCGRL